MYWSRIDAQTQNVIRSGFCQRFYGQQFFFFIFCCFDVSGNVDFSLVPSVSVHRHINTRAGSIPFQWIIPRILNASLLSTVNKVWKTFTPAIGRTRRSLTRPIEREWRNTQNRIGFIRADVCCWLCSCINCRTFHWPGPMIIIIKNDNYAIEC